MSKRRFRTRLVVRESTEIHRCEAWQIDEGAFCEFDGTLHQRVSTGPKQRADVPLCRVDSGVVNYVPFRSTVVPLPEVTLIFSRSSVEPVECQPYTPDIDEPVKSDAVSTIMANVMAAERMIEGTQERQRAGNRIPKHVMTSDLAVLSSMVGETTGLIDGVLDEYRDEVNGTIEGVSNIDDDFLDRLLDRAATADVKFRTKVSKLYDAKQRLGAVVEWCALQLKQITPDKEEDAQADHEEHQEEPAEIDASERDPQKDRPF